MQHPAGEMHGHEQDASGGERRCLGVAIQWRAATSCSTRATSCRSLRLAKLRDYMGAAIGVKIARARGT